MITKFKPMLAIDATDQLDNIRYHKLTSYKLDGIRCIFHPVLNMISRTLKPIQNKQLREKFEYMVELSKSTKTIFDGELYAHDLTFQEITRVVMTQDFWDPNTQKKLVKELKFVDKIEYIKYVNNLISKTKFHMFEFIESNDNNPTFNHRYKVMEKHKKFFKSNVIVVKQTIINSPEEVKKLFIKALDDGYEGLILRCPDSPYKSGRSTLKEEWMLKVKPFETFDAKIIGVQQATEVDPNAKKSINELGYSVTSKKKNDRILVERASAFFVMYKGIELKVSLAMTNEEKADVWKNKTIYIGKMIEYEGMQIGAKDVPRHPTFVRFREDRD